MSNLGWLGFGGSDRGTITCCLATGIYTIIAVNDCEVTFWKNKQKLEFYFKGRNNIIFKILFLSTITFWGSWWLKYKQKLLLLKTMTAYVQALKRHISRLWRHMWLLQTSDMHSQSKILFLDRFQVRNQDLKE